MDSGRGKAGGPILLRDAFSPSSTRCSYSMTRFCRTRSLKRENIRKRAIVIAGSNHAQALGPNDPIDGLTETNVNKSSGTSPQQFAHRSPAGTVKGEDQKGHEFEAGPSKGTACEVTITYGIAIFDFVASAQ